MRSPDSRQPALPSERLEDVLLLLLLLLLPRLLPLLRCSAAPLLLAPPSPEAPSRERRAWR